MVGLVQQTRVALLHPVLRNRCRNILTSAECQSINFDFNGAYINGFGFSNIVQALVSNNQRQGGLNIDTDDGGGLLPAGAAAQYYSDTNMFLFANEDTGLQPNERLYIVHEAAHAIIDMHNCKVGTLTDETCAYIAGAIYNLNLPVRVSVSGPIFVEAEKIATVIKARRKEYKFASSYSLYSRDVGALQAAIQADSIYRGISDTAFTRGGVPMGRAT